MTLWDVYTLSESFHTKFETSWSQCKRLTFKIMKVCEISNFIVILMKRFVLLHFKLRVLILNVWHLLWLHEVSKLVSELSDIVYLSQSVIEVILNSNRTFWFWLENFLFQCNFVAKRQRHECWELNFLVSKSHSDTRFIFVWVRRTR